MNLGDSTITLHSLRLFPQIVRDLALSFIIRWSSALSLSLSLSLSMDLLFPCAAFCSQKYSGNCIVLILRVPLKHSVMSVRSVTAYKTLGVGERKPLREQVIQARLAQCRLGRRESEFGELQEVGIQRAYVHGHRAIHRESKQPGKFARCKTPKAQNLLPPSLSLSQLLVPNPKVLFALTPRRAGARAGRWIPWFPDPVPMFPTVPKSVRFGMSKVLLDIMWGTSGILTLPTLFQAR